MGKIAFVFSGQGAQKAGMGKSFFDGDADVRELFQQAEARRAGTLAQCFAGSAQELKQTENTQPCLYLADLAAAMALSNQGVQPEGVAGFSLGEIPALAFAGAYDKVDGFRLACARGHAMGQTAKKYPASMVAVMRLEKDVVEEICKTFRQVYPVNYNAPSQLVVAGRLDEMERFARAVKAAGGRTMPVAVGGGFHAPFMDEAAVAFGEALAGIAVKPPRIPVYSNTTAMPYGENVGELMTRQINHPLRWQESIEQMAADGFDTFIEVGVGTTLKKLIARILPECRVFAVSSLEEMEQVKAEIR